MKHLLILLLTLSISTLYGQDIYKSVDGSISFFSETPVENINAANRQLQALINTKNGEVAFVVTNVGFEFDKPLMGEHFNENYMESDKYKISVFKGKIVETIDYSANGEHNVTVKGTIDIHGVTQEREMTGKLIIKDGTIAIMCSFDVLLKDHKIKIPKVVTKNIAETVKVTVNISLKPKK